MDWVKSGVQIQTLPFRPCGFGQVVSLPEPRFLGWEMSAHNSLPWGAVSISTEEDRKGLAQSCIPAGDSSSIPRSKGLDSLEMGQRKNAMLARRRLLRCLRLAKGCSQGWLGPSHCCHRCELHRSHLHRVRLSSGVIIQSLTFIHHVPHVRAGCC